MNYCHKLLVCVFVWLAAGDCVAQVKVENAWIKLAPPAATVNAAYMQVHNAQARPQTIVNLSADCCTMVMLHETRIEGDKVLMNHLDHLVIPAQERVQLAPGGMHIMLMGAKESLMLGNKVKIILNFDDGSSQEIELVVKKDDS